MSARRLLRAAAWLMSMPVQAVQICMHGSLTGKPMYLCTQPLLDGLPSPLSPSRARSRSLSQPLLARGGTLLTRLGHWNRCSYIHTAWHKLDGKFLQVGGWVGGWLVRGCSGRTPPDHASSRLPAPPSRLHVCMPLGKGESGGSAPG